MSPPSKRPTWAERRAARHQETAVDTVLAYHQAYDELRAPKVHRPGTPKVPAGGRWLSFMLAIVALFVAMAGIYLGAPVLGNAEWNLPFFVGGIGLGAVICSWLSIRWRLGAGPGRWPFTTSLLLVLIFASFCYGAHVTLVLDGKPVLTTSAEAKAWRYSQEIRKDYMTLSRFDGYLSYDDAKAQANISLYEKSSKQAQSMNVKYQSKQQQLPAPEYADVTQAMARAASLIASELELRAQLANHFDIDAEDQLKAERTDSVTLLRAVPSTIETIGQAKYGFSVFTPPKGVAE